MAKAADRSWHRPTEPRASVRGAGFRTRQRMRAVALLRKERATPGVGLAAGVQLRGDVERRTGVVLAGFALGDEFDLRAVGALAGPAVALRARLHAGDVELA